MDKERCLSVQMKIFGLSLALLLLNDFYLKSTFHNTFTGKLSDFTGLLIFPWFWSLFFNTKAKWVYAATALLFVFWKNPISQPLLDCIGSLFGFTLSRIEDPSDLTALFILPLSYYLYKNSKQDVNRVPTFAKYSLSAVALFAFIATSAPELYVQPNFEFNESYTINCSKEILLTKKMKSNSTRFSQEELLQLEEYSIEALGSPFTFYFDAKITPIDSNSTDFTLTKIKSYVLEGTMKERDALMKQQLQLRFERDVINYLKGFDTTQNFTLISYKELQLR